MRRRRFLLGGTLLALGTVTACAPSGPEDGVEIIGYGPDESQRLELTRPEGRSRGVVVVIHGGFWQAQYDLALGRPLAKDLAARGWTAANIEYRRVGNGGGWPTTGQDVADAIDTVAARDDVDASTLISLGHSAGGHLAVWAVGRTRTARITGAVSQAGVLDLAAARAARLGGGAVDSLLGPAGDLRDADPMAATPLAVPVRCVHGGADAIVPIAQSRAYVDAAARAGADATLTEVDGDHFAVIDVRSVAWERTRQILDELVDT